MKNGTKKVLFLIFGLSLLIFWNGVYTNYIEQTKDITLADNGKIVVLQRESWNWEDGYPSTNYLKQINDIISALDFYGYPYDIITYENATNEILRNYSAMIAVNPVEYSSTVQNFVEDNNKWALIYYNCDDILKSRYNLRNSFIVPNVSSVNKSSFSGNITEGMDDLAIWYYIKYDTGANAEVCVRNNLGDPILTKATNGKGTIVFFLNRIASTNYNNYRMIHNFINEATGNMPLITGSTPYAMNLVVLMRYDDYFTSVKSSIKLYDLSHACTIGSPLNGTTKEALSLAQDADFEPHCYDHVDLSELSCDATYSEISKGSAKYYGFFGKYPNGLICPYNNLSSNVVYALNNLNTNGQTYRWVTSAGSKMDGPVHYYGEYLGNDIWILADEGISFQEVNVTKEYLENLKQKRCSIMYLEHPDECEADGTLSSSIQKLSDLINNTTKVEGIYFSNVSAYVKMLDESKKVYVSGNQLIVLFNIDSGLTFSKKNLNSRIVIDDSKATILMRRDATMIPALTAGNHSFRYSMKYPYISEFSNGSLISDGYYDIQNSTVYFAITDDDELYKKTDIVISGLDNNSSYSLYSNGKIICNNMLPSKSGNLSLSSINSGDYCIKVNETSLEGRENITLTSVVAT